MSVTPDVKWTQKNGPCEHPYSPWTVWMENIPDGYLLTCQVCGNWQAIVGQSENAKLRTEQPDEVMW